MSKIKRRLRGYEKHGDQLVFEYLLPPLNLAYLQELFNIKECDQMYDAYEITEKQKNEISKYINDVINWEGYDWFIE